MDTKGILTGILSEVGQNTREFADTIGYSLTKLYDVQRGKTKRLSDELINLILEKYPNFNKVWLLTGEGEMLKSDTQKHQGITKELPRNYQGTTTPQRKRIPLYSDTTSIGGYNTEVADVQNPNTNAAEWIDAGDWFPEATAAIRHYGDSMLEYPAGSILVLKRVHDKRLIINGRNYVIETTEFRITKQLQYDGGDFLMAYSSNTDTYPDGRQIHSPIKIPLDTIRHIDLVLGCVQKEYSNGAIPVINTQNELF